MVDAVAEPDANNLCKYSKRIGSFLSILYSKLDDDDDSVLFLRMYCDQFS
jgi:hypothetical protein